MYKSVIVILKKKISTGDSFCRLFRPVYWAISSRWWNLLLDGHHLGYSRPICLLLQLPYSTEIKQSSDKNRATSYQAIM